MMATSQEELHNLVPAELLQSSLLVEDVPVASREATEDAVVTLFASKGRLARLILQVKPGQESQRAIASYTEAEDALQALSLDGSRILGGRITVKLLSGVLGEGEEAVALNAEEAQSRQSEDGDAAAEALKKLHQSVVGLLATGIVMGEKGNAWLRDLDASTGLSTRISEAVRYGTESANRIDQRYEITAKFQGTFGCIADDITARAYDLDDRLSASGTARNLAQRVESASQAAMEQPTIRSVFESVGAVTQWGVQTWKETWSAASVMATARRDSTEEAEGRADSGDVPEEYGEPQGKPASV